MSDGNHPHHRIVSAESNSTDCVLNIKEPGNNQIIDKAALDSANTQR